MRIPTVHINGTDGAELLDQTEQAARVVTLAICKIRAAWPNGRDYYVQGDDATNEAQKEWESRVDKLAEVLGDLNQIAKGISGQLEKQGVDPWAPR